MTALSPFLASEAVHAACARPLRRCSWLVAAVLEVAPKPALRRIHASSQTQQVIDSTRDTRERVWAARFSVSTHRRLRCAAAVRRLSKCAPCKTSIMCTLGDKYVSKHVLMLCALRHKLLLSVVDMRTSALRARV